MKYWLAVFAAIIRRQFTQPPHPPFPRRQVCDGEEFADRMAKRSLSALAHESWKAKQ